MKTGGNHNSEVPLYLHTRIPVMPIKSTCKEIERFLLRDYVTHYTLSICAVTLSKDNTTCTGGIDGRTDFLSLLPRWGGPGWNSPKRYDLDGLASWVPTHQDYREMMQKDAGISATAVQLAAPVPIRQAETTNNDQCDRAYLWAEEC